MWLAARGFDTASRLGKASAAMQKVLFRVKVEFPRDHTFSFAAHSDRLVRLYAKGPSGHYGAGFSYPEFELVRRRPSYEPLFLDLRDALPQLAKSPGFTLLAIFMLALEHWSEYCCFQFYRRSVAETVTCCARVMRSVMHDPAKSCGL
jgi:hypothetical protein